MWQAFKWWLLGGVRYTPYPDWIAKDIAESEFLRERVGSGYMRDRSPVWTRVYRRFRRRLVMRSGVKIIVTVGRNRARVRRVVFDDRGRVKAKYGLTVTGRWVQVPEGERYPDECLLPVRFLDWLVPAMQEIKRWLQGTRF